MNKCYFCGEKLKKEKTNIARYWGKELIALNNVPVLVCTACGERYFSAKVSHRIDAMIKEALERKSSISKIDVPVVHF